MGLRVNLLDSFDDASCTLFVGLRVRFARRRVEDVMCPLLVQAAVDNARLSRVFPSACKETFSQNTFCLLQNVRHHTRYCCRQQHSGWVQENLMANNFSRLLANCGRKIDFSLLFLHLTLAIGSKKACRAWLRSRSTRCQQMVRSRSSSNVFIQREKG